MAESPELKEGSPAIDFTLTDANGQLVSLHDFFPSSNVYLFFVREFE